MMAEPYVIRGKRRRTVGAVFMGLGGLLVLAALAVTQARTSSVTAFVLLALVGAFYVAFGLKIWTAYVQFDASAVSYRVWFRTRRIPWSGVKAIRVGRARAPLRRVNVRFVLIETADGRSTRLPGTARYDIPDRDAEFQEYLSVAESAWAYGRGSATGS